jgi:hypothetical protein
MIRVGLTSSLFCEPVRLLASDLHEISLCQDHTLVVKSKNRLARGDSDFRATILFTRTMPERTITDYLLPVS